MELLGGEKFILATETEHLSSKSIVYSFGVGTDISWDLDLIQKYGCTIYAFDPTPRSIVWVGTQQLPPQFKFYPYGLAHYDGNMPFYDPPNPKNVSYSPARKNGTPSYFPVKRLSTIMHELGHDHIDLLKVDVEGGEFALIPDILHLPIKQLLIEFHSRFFRFGLMKRILAIIKIRSAGFKLFYQHGNDWSFVRR